MIKEIKTEKFEGLAVLVPDEVADCWKNETYHVNTLWYKNAVMRFPKHIDLPAGEWKILGKATELTEEQCELIADLRPRFQNRSYRRHFNALLIKLRCYSICPMEKPDINNEKYVPISDDVKDTIFMHDWDRWEEVQANTGTWLILQKL